MASGFLRGLYLHRVAALAAGFVVFGDQLTKNLAQTQWFEAGPSLGAMTLKLSANPGLALGVLGGLPLVFRLPLFLAISLFAAFAIAAVSKPFSTSAQARGWGLALIYAGAAGNSIDRLCHEGAVTDFIELKLGGTALPAFNLADLSVAAGALLVAAIVAIGAARRRAAPRQGGEMETPQNDLALLEAPAPEEGGRRPGAVVKMLPGTTLVEILIVVAIIGLVLGAVAIGVIPLFKKGQRGIAWNGTQTIAQMFVAWQALNPDKDCPDSVEELAKAAGKKGQDPNDPWGQAYQIRCPSENGLDVDVYSMGPDKKGGTEDDVGNWMKQPKD
jgi:general secretion pathway protein G